MTASIVSSAFTYGPWPDNSDLISDVALQAGATFGEAENAIAVAWSLASNFTRRTYRSVLTGQVLVRQEGFSWFFWPIWPEPQEVTSELLSGRDWVPHNGFYIPGLGLDLDGAGLYRLSQVGEVDAPAIPANVTEAVRCLALYLLIQSPHRREFKTQGAGDSQFSRESYMGFLYGSGAGAMLASEVRL